MPLIGSSPLARGLPRVRQGARNLAGIIPARAGFTDCRNIVRRIHGDHPRSRGVYLHIHAGNANAAGSSPLARGLQRAQQFRRARQRIIPARAGFTDSAGLCPPAVEDHPRSRGVYFYSHIFRKFVGGSSPLARGLPCHLQCGPQTMGIIPARAGFTGR